jgi:hypothetical protein
MISPHRTTVLLEDDAASLSRRVADRPRGPLKIAIAADDA